MAVPHACGASSLAVPPNPDSRHRRNHVLACLAVLGLAAAYLRSIACEGWIPHDEGLLAHGAERVLAGELPHRDFDEVYTGGLEYLHAAAFALLGPRIGTLRLVLLGASLAFLAVLYGIAARFLRPLAAAAVVATAGIWSLPNYFAPLPSWYVLFLATLGLAASLAALERGRGRWWFLAGACAGLAFLVKSVGGVYTAAAGLATLAYAEEPRRAAEVAPERAPRGLRALVALALLGGTLLLVRRRLGPMEAFHFVLPVAALAGVLSWTEFRGGGPTLRTLATRALPWLAGLVLPIAAFLVPYAATGALDDFVRGVFVLPQRRLEHASHPFPPPWTLVTALPPALVLLLTRGTRARVAGGLLAFALGLLALWILLPGFERSYALFWCSVRPLVPLAALAGALALVRRRDALEPRSRAALFAVLASAVFASLNQFPYSSPLYFCYAAPLAAVAVAAVARRPQEGPGPRTLALVALLAVYALFGVRWLLPGAVRTLGLVFKPRPDLEELPLERAGLRVPGDHALIYPVLAAEAGARSAPGSAIYAAPDCPEVYFLCGRRNPTRTMYDLFDSDWDAPEARRRRILDTLEAERVQVVVLRQRGEFSGPIEGGLQDELVRRYPGSRDIGHFQVRWRP